MKKEKVRMEQIELNDIGGRDSYFSIIESLLFAAGDPLHINNIAAIIECSVGFTERIMEEMKKYYEEDEKSGLKIINTNSEYQLVTKPQNSDHIQKLLKTNVRQSLSRAALETLAIIAYRQPITRVDVEEIRGVKSERAIYTLVEKGLIKESGKKEVVGRPNLYITTDKFLKHFNFTNIDELPPLESFVAAGDEEAEQIVIDNVD